MISRRRRSGTGSAPLQHGDVVEVRAPAEILATLDDEGRLGGVPFMPEMLGYLGGRFAVEARAERACDTITQTGARRMPDTVLLDDLRCDGGGHGGCQAGCRIYWKEAWLRRATRDAEPAPVEHDEAFTRLERLAAANARKSRPDDAGTPIVFRCQATDFLQATEPLGWWDVRSFVHEVTCGNISLWRFIRVMTRLAFDETGRRLGLSSNMPFKRPGDGAPHPPRSELKPGDLVQIRPKREIAGTLDEKGKCRGLWFDREMLPYCGETHTVKRKVERFINERTGTMIELESDCYILDGVVCKGDVSEARWFCPRAIYPWWREAWLDSDVARAERKQRRA